MISPNPIYFFYSFSCKSYHISYFEFHVIIILSTKNFPSSSSGISADSRSRYSGSKSVHIISASVIFQLSLSRVSLIYLLIIFSEVLFFTNSLSQTNCHNKLSRLTMLLMCFPSGFMYHSELYTKILDDLIIIFLDFSPQGFHPLCIRELRRFSNSCIIYKKEIKV
nr:MAG TPA: hypothetical protein [Caudoviricetes sp.]